MNSLINKNRMGRFWISLSHVEDHPEEIIELFYQKKIIIVRCELQYHRMAFEYVGTCPDFDEVPPNMVYPDYDILVHREEGKVSFSFQRLGY